MPRKRTSTEPKPYGRQAEGKTIKSLSMDADLVQWAQAQAVAASLSLSAWLNETLRSRMTRTAPSPPPRSAKPPAKTTKPAPPVRGKKAK